MPDQLKPCPFEKATTCSMDETCEGCEIWAGVKAKYDIAYKAGEAAERERCIRAVEVLEQTVNKQAEDEGLWFMARTCPEAYLQQELRQLHAEAEATIARIKGEPNQ